MCGSNDKPRGGPVSGDDEGFDPYAGRDARQAGDYTRYPWRHRFAPVLALVALAMCEGDDRGTTKRQEDRRPWPRLFARLAAIIARPRRI